MLQELPPNTYDQVTKLSAEGDRLAEANAYEEAIQKYNDAWQLIPEPKNDWEASTWLLTAIGDACFQACFFTSGTEAFEYALKCPAGFGNPFIHLRLGQCKFEKEDFTSAAEHLARAYMLEGKNIFAEDSPKYFEFLKTKLEPPVSGVW